MNSFVALDVETANTDYSSICAIGAARFDNYPEIETFYSLVNPQTSFMYTDLHGISAFDVHDQPTFPEILPTVCEFVGERRIVSHSAFDRTAFRQAAAEYDVQLPDWEWLDSLRVARRAWPDLAGGHGLDVLCERIGYEFEHHHALEDAIACGEVLLAALEDLPDVDPSVIVEWPVRWRDQKPKPVKSRSAIQSKPIKEHSTPSESTAPRLVLDGQVVTISMLVADAMKVSALALLHGAKISSKLTPRTTIFVTSDNSSRMRHSETRTDSRQASYRQAKERQTTFMSETDFLAMIENS